MKNEFENEIISVTAGENDEKKRLDSFCSEAFSLTRSGAVIQLEDGNITVNGKVESKNYRLKNGDIIEFEPPEPKSTEIIPEDIPLNIAYEDEHLIVVNKPQGMVVHPAYGNESGTLVNALLHYCGSSLSGINGVIRPGIVHRIDKDTSGLLIVAKTNDAHLGLAEQIKEHSFTRRYQAINVGYFKESAGKIDLPIGRHPVDRKKMAVTNQNSRNAITHYRTIEELCGFSHMEFDLETGRTHQIRVHMAHVGHPILGDPVYSNTKKYSEKFHLQGQCLHAKFIEFVHPITNEVISLDSEIPEYMKNVIEKLKNE